jgi:cytidylate kinase
MNICPLTWIIISVSGSGKSAIGRLLAQNLKCDFLEGDRRHPLANVLKMSSQQPLTDTDRRPWLLAIEDDLRRSIDIIDGNKSIDDVMKDLMTTAIHRFPSLQKPWWERSLE